MSAPNTDGAIAATCAGLNSAMKEDGAESSCVAVTPAICAVVSDATCADVSELKGPIAPICAADHAPSCDVLNEATCVPVRFEI